MMGGRRGDATQPSEHGWLLQAVTCIGDGLIVVDEDGRTVYENPAAEQALGGSSDATSESRWMTGEGLLATDETTPLPRASVPLVRALETGVEVRDARLVLAGADGARRVHVIASASPLREPDGRIRGAACIFREVTPSREQQAKLDEGARQKKAILDNIPDIAWLKDEHGRFLLVNEPLAAAAGRACPDEMVGLTDSDLWPPELASRYRADDEEVMRTRLHKRVEEPFIARDGQRFWIETFKTCIVDDKGKVIGTTGIARDITARKRVEEELRSTKDELERRVLERTAELARAQENLVRQERLAVLGQLAGGVAHQIRNPLAAIMNASYVLKRHLAPDQHPNVGDAIRIIHDEVRHANVIITGLLDYASVRTPTPHPTSLVDLLERALSSEWIPANITVVRELPADGVTGDVDAEQLHGAFANIVRNAVDAMPDGGELGIALTLDGGEIVITISDTGEGISPQVRAHLFQPLHSTKPMGVGLGLVTARRFIEAHGGRIACLDAPRGARFEIRLPAT